MPQPTNSVIIERLENLIEQNTCAHKDIKESMDKTFKDHEDRLKALEFWKVGFVAQFSVYSAIALFFGSLVANLAIKYLFAKL